MPANTTPLYGLTPSISKLNMTGNIGLATSDGTATIGTNIFKLETGGTFGTFINKIRINPYAAVAGTNTVATIYRFYHSTQTVGGTLPSNTFLFKEIAVGILTAASLANANELIEFPLNYSLPSGETILVSTHANFAANTGAQIICINSDF